MSTIQAMYIRDLVPVYSMEVVSFVSPYQIQLRGTDFSSAYAVEYNRRIITDLVVQTRHLMLVTLPDGLVDEAPKEIAVLSEAFTSTPSSRVDFKLDAPGRRTTGLHKLVQQFLLVLLTTPGSVADRPTEGAGLLRVMRGPYSITQGADIATAATSCVSRAVHQLQVDQSGRNVPADERLLSATLEHTEIDRVAGRVKLVISLTNAAGQSTQANIGL